MFELNFLFYLSPIICTISSFLRRAERKHANPEEGYCFFNGIRIYWRKLKHVWRYAQMETQKLEKETMIAEVLEMDYAEEIIPLFTAIGMHCLGCAAASQETVEEACMVHGIDPDAFVSAVNGVIEGLAAQKAQ